MEYRVEECPPQEWGTLLEETGGGSIYHRIDWLRTTEKHMGGELHLLKFINVAEVAGIIPLYLQRRGHGLVKVLTSCPGGSLMPYLGPLFTHYDDCKQDKRESLLSGLQVALTHYAGEVGADSINIIFTPKIHDMRPFTWAGWDVKPLYTYTQKLSDLDTIWIGFKKELRKNINNSEKSSVTVREGGSDDLDFIYSTISNRLNEQRKTLIAPKQYLHELFDTFHPANMRVFVLEHKDERIGGVVITCYGGRASVWFGAAQPNVSGLYPNDQLHWHIIKWATQEGYDEFEIIGANQPSISHYKARFNLDLQLYFSATKSPRLIQILRSTVRAHSP